MSRQQINQACRRMERRGELLRERGPDGKIVNRLRTDGSNATPAAPPVSVEEPWFWEGNVQSSLRRHLEASGWRILREADTAVQERGIDLLAEREDLRLAVEVKGFPKTTYQRGRKRGQPKPTPPTLQAKHWFSDAVMTLIRLRSEEPDAALALALPDYPRYQALLAESHWALKRLGFGVFLVDASGAVSEYVTPRAPGD